MLYGLELATVYQSLRSEKELISSWDEKICIYLEIVISQMDAEKGGDGRGGLDKYEI